MCPICLPSLPARISPRSWPRRRRPLREVIEAKDAQLAAARAALEATGHPAGVDGITVGIVV